jgi:serine/threonine-protein kinase
MTEGAKSAEVGQGVAPRDPLAGTAYRSIGEVGRGGMAVVLEAEHLALGKRVVVKLLLGHFVDREDVAARLRREGRSLARLKSPFVVDVTDIGQTADGSPFIVMELLHGRTLAQELRLEGRVALPDALRWTRQILSGLAVAHRFGIVHRDVKLANVFLCDPVLPGAKRDVKLLDFGIAKIVSDPGGGLLSRHHHVTAQGQMLGTPRCIAPEQALGKPIDGRADLYAVGVLLYTMVAGRGPFEHIKDAIEVIQANIAETPTPPSTHAAGGVPPEVDQLVLKAMEKEPGRRHQTADAFSEAIAAIEEQLTGSTQPLGPALPAASGAAHPPSTSAVAAEDDDLAKTRLLPAPPAPRPAATAPLAPPRRPWVFVALTLVSALVFSGILALVMRGG